MDWPVCKLQVCKFVFWLNLPHQNDKTFFTSNVKNFSHLEMDIFCYFNFCHCRRNNFCAVDLFIGPIIFMIFYQSCGAEYCPITDLSVPKNSCGNLRTYFPSCFLHSDFELENFMIFIALIVLVWFGSSWVAFKTSRANISWDVQPNQEVSIKIADFAEKTVYQKSNFLDDSPKCATCKLCKLSLSLICVIYVTLVS